MKKLLFVAAFLVVCEGVGFAQGIVWNWVLNRQGPYSGFPDPIGDPVYIAPGYPVRSIPLDMDADGTVDFEFRAIADGGGQTVEVLQHSANEVLAFTVPPPDIGQIAIALTRPDRVGSLNPVGAWLTYIPGFLGDIGSKLDGQFADKRSYIGVRFYAADGIHYGALETAIWNDAGILYGYGYNPVPGAPFNLSEIRPVPEPSTWALLALGAAFLAARRTTARM